MKHYFLKILGLLLVLNNTTQLYSQETTHKDDIKEILGKLFESSNKKDFESAAQYIAYSGDDEKRNNVDIYNVADRYELNQVKRLCKQLSALMQLSKYKIGEYKATLDNGITHYNLFVHFSSGEQEIIKRFQFLKSGEKYLLDIID